MSSGGRQCGIGGSIKLWDVIEGRFKSHTTNKWTDVVELQVQTGVCVCEVSVCVSGSPALNACWCVFICRPCCAAGTATWLRPRYLRCPSCCPSRCCQSTHRVPVKRRHTWRRMAGAGCPDGISGEWWPCSWWGRRVDPQRLPSFLFLPLLLPPVLETSDHPSRIWSFDVLRTFMLKEPSFKTPQFLFLSIFTKVLSLNS